MSIGPANLQAFLNLGTLCNILTVLKHENTIICLQIFTKHALQTCFSEKNASSVFRVEMSVFVLVYVIPPTAILPNSILTPRVASWWKTQRIAPMQAANKLGQRSQILPNLKSLGIHLKSYMARGILKCE